MRTYILRRLLQIVPTILMITLVVFVMMQSIPGDPVVALLGDAYTEEDAVKVREAYGLDKPVLVQYVIWLGKLVRGDWCTSILSGRPVLKDVMVRLPVTLELIVLSMGVALIIAIPAAIIGALRQNTWADYTATSVAMIGVSIPEFFIGVLLLLVFSTGLGMGLPAGHVPDHRVRREPVGKHDPRADAGPRPRRRPRRPAHAPAAREHAGGDPHRVRHHRARQGLGRA